MLSEYFQESYRDLVIKTNNNNLQIMKNKVILDIKKEFVNSDKTVKTHALMKLLFLYLNDSDISWASMNTLEVISTCGKFGKRIGYIVGQIQFKANNEKILLIPNLFLKELKSGDNVCISLALNFITIVLEKSLATQLITDFDKILNINNDNIRKRVIVTICRSVKIINDEERVQKFILSLAKLLENHKSLSNSILISIVSCIQELCYTYPKQILLIFKPLIEYFKECEINWIIIKILDIFNVLCEKIRKDLIDVSKDLLNHLGNMIKKNISKSVEVQIIKLVILNVNPNKQPEIVQKCEQSLKKLLLISDNNLILLSLKVIKSLVIAKKIISKTYLPDIQTLLLKYFGNERISINKNNELINFDKIYIECIEIITLSADVSNYKIICEKNLSHSDGDNNKLNDSHSLHNQTLYKVKLNCFLSIVLKEDIFKDVIENLNNSKINNNQNNNQDNWVLSLFFDLLYKSDNIDKEKDLENSIVNFLTKLNISSNKYLLTEKLALYLKQENSRNHSRNNSKLSNLNNIIQFPPVNYFEYKYMNEHYNLKHLSHSNVDLNIKDCKNKVIIEILINILSKNLYELADFLPFNNNKSILFKNCLEIFDNYLKINFYVEIILLSITNIITKIASYVLDSNNCISIEKLEIYDLFKNFLLNLIKECEDIKNEEYSYFKYLCLNFNNYISVCTDSNINKLPNFQFSVFVYMQEIFLNLSDYLKDKNSEFSDSFSLMKILSLNFGSENIKNDISSVNIKDIDIYIDKEEFEIDKSNKRELA